ncbi:MAG: sigma 54-interacting transcriptional regulator [Planctomycetota bacterium]
MSRVSFARQAALARIHVTLDSFYLRQEIDWDYDIRELLDRILDLGLKQLEFGTSRASERALIIVKPASGGELEVGAGWRVEEDLSYSRTVVSETIATGLPVRYDDASNDPRFVNAKSLQDLQVVSLMSVPILSEARTLGAIYLERRDAGYIFTPEDSDFLQQFAATIAPYVKTALIHQAHVAEINALKSARESGAGLPNLLGNSKPMQKVADLARIASSVEKTVLITGESGSGKELLARAIHARSRRAERPFVVVDCSGLSSSLLESELFGHARGSFTGAIAEKAGAFEEANGGTLFLDEISDAPKAMQQQLRRVLQESEIRRVGESEYRKVDVRVICATNRDLKAQVEAGLFIHDLYHRIHQFPIRMPALSERREDIPMLVDHFIALSGSVKNPPVRMIAPEALSRLVARDWRENNVRELRNVVGLAVDLAQGAEITLDTMRRTLELRGETGERGGDVGSSNLAAHGANASPGATALDCDGGCCALDRAVTNRMFEETNAEDPKEKRPYYRAQREFSGKLIVECLRYNNWKLRPAARLLGISAVKLRQDFREYLEWLITRALAASAPPNATGNEAHVERTLAKALEMPPDTLRRKLTDLGLSLEGAGIKSETEGDA